MKTEPTESLSIKRANIVDKYLPVGDEQRYYHRLEMHEELIDLINSHYPKIKQLEWKYDEEFFIWEANSVFGKYFVKAGKNEGALMVDANKSAAQRDFEKRIKECLE